MYVLKVKAVSISYNSELVVNNVSFDISENDYFCITGSNGSGKSSLIKCIMGLIPACKGEIQLGIQKEQTAYLPQTSTVSNNLPATVWEVVLTGTQKANKKLPFYTKIDKKIAIEKMDMLNIYDLCKKRIGELSGGQLQRVLLARALCREPKLLILDEPCTGLDEEVTTLFYETLRNLNKQNNISILMISHDLEEVYKNAKRVAVLDKSLKFCGSVDEWKEFRKKGSNTIVDRFIEEKHTTFTREVKRSFTGKLKGELNEY